MYPRVPGNTTVLVLKKHSKTGNSVIYSVYTYFDLRNPVKN